MEELYAINPIFLSNYLFILENATDAQRAAAESRFGDTTLPEILSVDASTGEASINITGVLTPKGPSFLARLFGYGGTAYEEIIKSVGTVKSNPSVTTVRLVFNTPGGTLSGADEAREAIESLAKEKEVIAENHGQMSSAGYFLASAARKIIAVTPFAMSGSIGIITGGVDVTEAMQKHGVKRIKIVSKNAPDKAPGVDTQHGRDLIQKQIDAAERVFIEAIAKGRDITSEYVIKNYGKGAELIARDPDEDTPDALSVGMIDEIRTREGEVHTKDTAPSAITEPKKFGYNIGITEGAEMTLAEFRAANPGVYAEAVQVGVTQENERAQAHIVLGEAAGDVNLALENIKSGAGMTALVQAKYTAAGMKNLAVTARAEEAPGVLPTPKASSADTEDAAIAEALAKEMGVSIDA